LSDNYRKQAQNNTVVVQQEKMDRVGFEPTTSAMLSVKRRSYSILIWYTINHTSFLMGVI
jgi:hypothetical protein